MSLNMSTSPSEQESTVRAMLFANLLGVFDERDPSKRATAVEDTYAEDVIWFEPDGVIHGRTALNARASELQTQSPGFHFSADGIMSVSQNVGVLRFCFGPENTRHTLTPRIGQSKPSTAPCPHRILRAEKLDGRLST
jgi:hypothetical protein